MSDRAEAVLNDPLVRGALDTMKNQLRDMFFILSPDDAAGREKLHLMDRMRQQFEGYFTALITNHKVEQSEILAEEHMRMRHEAIMRSVRER